MKRTLALFVLILSFTLASAGCALQSPDKDNAAPAKEDAGSNGSNTDADTDTGTDTFSLFTPGPVVSVFRTSDLGGLVRAPDSTRVETWEKPSWSHESIASAKFVRPSGQQYNLLVYNSNPSLAFSSWMARSEVGNSFLSPQTVRTADGETAYVYKSNDLGAVPDIHVTIPTAEFVYNFMLDSGLPENPEEAVRAMRDEPERNWFEIPEDFLSFIAQIEVR